MKIDVLFRLKLSCTYDCLTVFLYDLDPLAMFKQLTQQLSHQTEKLPSYADFLLKKTFTA